MALNRPDRPLRNDERDRRAPQDHPDRGAHLQERADGAHAEQVDRPTPTPSPPPGPDDSPQGPDIDGDGRHHAEPGDPRHGPAPRAQGGRMRGSRSPVTLVVVGVLVVMGLIYAAMVAGVFTVG